MKFARPNPFSGLRFVPLWAEEMNFFSGLKFVHRIRLLISGGLSSTPLSSSSSSSSSSSRQIPNAIWSTKHRWIGYDLRHDGLLHKTTEGRMAGKASRWRRRIQMLYMVWQMVATLSRKCLYSKHKSPHQSCPVFLTCSGLNVCKT